MRKISIVFCLAFSMLAFSTQPVHAQFWKKIFKKEEKKRPDKQRSTAPEKKIEERSELKKQVLPTFPVQEKKSAYRIDLLLPLHLNSLVVAGKAVQKSTPESVLPYINFYEGMLLAADTLAAMGQKVDIYVHDIKDPSSGIDALTAPGSTMNGTDLIIGTLQSNEIPEVAAFAKTNKVNFLSALSPADAGVKDNPYFILVQPTLNTHLHQMIKYALRQFKAQPKVLLYEMQTSGEREAYEQLTDALATEKNIQALQISGTLPDSAALAALLEPGKRNVVFISVLKTGSAETLLKTLAALSDQYDIEVFGMPSWKSIRGLTTPGYYGNLTINYTTPFHYNYQSPRGTAIRTAYTERFGGTASEMVLRGYESLYWMSHLLNRYGPVFNESMSKIGDISFTKYDIKPAWSGKNDFLYFENNQLYIFRYHQGIMQVINP